MYRLLFPILLLAVCLTGSPGCDKEKPREEKFINPNKPIDIPKLNTDKDTSATDPDTPVQSPEGPPKK